MFGNVKRWVVVLAATALLAGSAVGAVAFAQTPPPTTTPGAPSTAPRTDYRQVFLAKLAALLGVDQQQLVDASKEAGKATVDEAVSKGDLAPNRADAAKSRIEQGQGGFPFPGLFREMGRPGRGFAGHGPAGFSLGGQDAVQAAADKLGMSVPDLHAALRSSKTLGDLAGEKNVALEEVTSAMVAAAKPSVEQAVTDGKLTQQQADAILQRIQEGNVLGFPGPRGGRR